MREDRLVSSISVKQDEISLLLCNDTEIIWIPKVSLTHAAFKVATGYKTKNIWKQCRQYEHAHQPGTRVEAAVGMFYFQHLE